MEPKLLPYALQDIPRYTSYPTAAQFGPLPGARFEGWLSAMPADASLSAYVHVPFCHQLCWYCGCHTSVPNAYARAERYTDAIVAEISHVLALLPKMPFRHLHFGGGTPTYLRPREFNRIFDAFRAFGLAADAELAVEIDPRTLDAEIRDNLAANGVNRVSFGVQDFSLAVQSKINRIQPFGLVAAAVDGLRAAGIEAINFDLIYGLPGQTLESVTETARLTAQLAPRRVAVFGYAHVPWFKKQQAMIRDADLPGVEQRFAQATRIGEVLQENGYIAVGLDHYVKPDDDMAKALAARHLKRNFQGYTTDMGEMLIGFGPSSISQLPQGFAQNARDQAAWTTAAEQGVTSVDRGLAVTAEDRMRADIISDIMCYLEADPAAIATRQGFAAETLAPAFTRLEELAADGLVEIAGTRIIIPPRHRLFCRTVAQAFDAHYTAAPGRHAKAV